MDLTKPIGTFTTQEELIKNWDKKVEEELNNYPSTLSWLLEETDIKCPDCNANLYKCYVNDPYTQKIYGEANLLYCTTDKAFYNEGNLTWVAIAGSGGGGSGTQGSLVRVIDNVLTITTLE